MSISDDRTHGSFYEEAAREAARAGLDLRYEGERLVLSDGRMSVAGDFSSLHERIRADRLQRELLVRAAHIKHAAAPLRAVDATAGLGEDSFLLAAAGFDVLLFERNAVMAALLADALDRASLDPALSAVAGRMRVERADSLLALGQLGFAPDVVLLDPMFPARRKSAAVKKKLQLLQKLERPCEDEAALFDAALGANPRKVVVKRPVKGPSLAQRKPSYVLAGKAVRYDCYVCP